MAALHLQIDEMLQTRLAKAADQAGLSVDAFVQLAIDQALDRAEPADAFDELADARWTAVLATGQTVSWNTARAYLEAKVRGESPPRPDA